MNRTIAITNTKNARVDDSVGGCFEIDRQTSASYPNGIERCIFQSLTLGKMISHLLFPRSQVYSDRSPDHSSRRRDSSMLAPLNRRDTRSIITEERHAIDLVVNLFTTDQLISRSLSLQGQITHQ